MNAHYCVLFSSRVKVKVRIRCSFRLVSGYVHVFVLLNAVIVTVPVCVRCIGTMRQWRWLNVVARAIRMWERSTICATTTCTPPEISSTRGTCLTQPSRYSRKHNTKSGDNDELFTYLPVRCGAVVRALDLRLEVAGSIPAAALSCANSDKLFTHIVQRLWCYNLTALYKSV